MEVPDLAQQLFYRLLKFIFANSLTLFHRILGYVSLLKDSVFMM